MIFIQNTVQLSPGLIARGFPLDKSSLCFVFYSWMMESLFSNVQTERSQLRIGRLGIRVDNGSNPQGLRYLGEHRPVLDVDHLIGRNLRDVQGDAVDIRIRLAEVDEAGGDEKVDETIQLETLYPVLCQLTAFVTDHDYLQSVLCLDSAY
jgi:hypothetical protein